METNPEDSSFTLTTSRSTNVNFSPRSTSSSTILPFGNSSRTLVPESQTGNSEGNSKGSLEKRAKIEEMKLKASLLKQKLEESEKRSAYARRIKELENELVKLSDEEAKRMMYIGQKAPLIRTPRICSDAGTGRTNLSTKTAHSEDVNRMRDFCKYFKENDLLTDNSKERVRGGGCGGCAALARPFLNFDQMLGRSSPSQVKNIFHPASAQAKPGGNAGINQMSDKNSPPKKPSRVEDLAKLIREIMVEIEKVRRQNTSNRRRIVELCVALKQKEAAILECSELLCHIMNDDDSANDVMNEVQGNQLQKHVDYLRWILIRLQFEGMAQQNEIETLIKENKNKDRTLKECRATKERLCAEKKAKEEVLNKYTMGGACDVPLVSLDIEEDDKGNDV